jgi:NADP-dependent 3-hydroxy acid dehydrogenase YdfG
MTENEVWFITGAGHGMGTDFAKAALAAGHSVVAAGRDPQIVADALGRADDLLVVKLDIAESVFADATRHDRQIATAVH